jgi:hypothetical protein
MISRFNSKIALAVLFVVPIFTLTACQTTAQRVATKEGSLAAAGFEQRPANTPKRRTMLAELPSNKFVTRTRGDVIHYVYADPAGCHCLYVGTQAAYGRYVRQKQAQHIADQQVFAAQEYSNARWNWGDWGWGGGYGSGFGFGNGFGW